MTASVREEMRTVALAEAVDHSPFTRLFGLALATVLPAAFWVSVLSAMAPLAGVAVSVSMLAVVGLAIVLLLASVCAPIMFRPPA